MFHLEVTDIHNSQKIDTMGIWKIFYSVNLNHSRWFYSLSNGTGYDLINVIPIEPLLNMIMDLPW